jgi:hypothetical protein
MFSWSSTRHCGVFRDRYEIAKPRWAKAAVDAPSAEVTFGALAVASNHVVRDPPLSGLLNLYEHAAWFVASTP